MCSIAGVRSKICATQEKFAYPSEVISIRIARRESDTYNSAGPWTKSVMMNIVDSTVERNLVGAP